MRKIILIVIILGFVGFTGWTLYSRVNNTGQNEGEQTGFRSFFPLTTTQEGTEQTLSEENTSITTPSETATPSAFTQLTNTPVSGFTIFTEEEKVTRPSTTPRGRPTIETVVHHILRYASRQSGFVYEIKNNETPLQITNLFVPNVYESVFIDSNNTVLHRFLRDDTQTVATYAVPIPPPNTDGSRTQKSGTFFTDNIEQIIPLTSTSVGYLLPRTTGASIFTSTGTDTKRKEVFRSPLQELSLLYQNSTLYGYTKPAGTVGGYLYRIDTTNGRFVKILGPLRGLTASVSPKGSFVLYSQSTTTGFTSFLFNTKTGASQPLGLALLPEKCVWLADENLICGGSPNVPEGTYPDVWYAGLVTFSDQLYRIYTASATFDVLEENAVFDITHPRVDETRGRLYFIDKQTGILWQFSF